ncbi:MAG: zinc ribbon domain-containing protein, partial [Halobacteriaceae archaeon]
TGVYSEGNSRTENANGSGQLPPEQADEQPGVGSMSQTGPGGDGQSGKLQEGGGSRGRDPESKSVSDPWGDQGRSNGEQDAERSDSARSSEPASERDIEQAGSPTGGELSGASESAESSESKRSNHDDIEDGDSFGTDGETTTDHAEEPPSASSPSTPVDDEVSDAGTIAATCPECGNGVDHESAYCRHCGASLEHLCNTCGNEVNPESKFCRHCGSEL